MGNASQFLVGAHPDVEMLDLIRAEDLAVIHEDEFKDSDGVEAHVYTVAGSLDGNRIEALDHVRKVIMGATVGGDVMVVHGRDRKEADWIAINGLLDTIENIRVMAEAGALDPDKNAGIITETQVVPKTS